MLCVGHCSWHVVKYVGKIGNLYTEAQCEAKVGMYVVHVCIACM